MSGTESICLAGPASLESLTAWLSAGAVRPGAPRGMGGTPVNLLAVELLKRGRSVVVVTLDPDVSREYVVDGPSLRIRIGPLRKRARHRVVDMFAAEQRYVREVIQDENPGIVHAHWTYEYALGALSAAVPHVVTAHDAPWRIVRYQPDLYRVVRLGMAYRALRAAKQVTAVSPYVAQHLARWHFTAAEVQVVPNGLPDEVFQRRAVRTPHRESLTFAMVLSGWVPLKNAKRGLAAFALVHRRHPASRLVCFGPGYGPAGPAMTWAAGEGLTGGVEFAGNLAHSDLLSRIADEVDVLVHPSLEESQGMGIIEAMALGVPVIAGSFSGAVPWTLSFGEAGLLVDVKSVEALADGMRRLAEDDVLRARLASAGFASAHERFHMSTVADAYERVYERAKDEA